MEDIAVRAGVSRTLLYKYFPGKRELFAAIYQRTADRLLDSARLGPDLPLADSVTADLDAHIPYFAAHRLTVFAANRTLAGDSLIQAIIDDELAALRARMLDAAGYTGHARDGTSAALREWLVLVRELCVEWRAPGDRAARSQPVPSVVTELAGLGELSGEPLECRTQVDQCVV